MESPLDHSTQGVLMKETTPTEPLSKASQQELLYGNYDYLGNNCVRAFSKGTHVQHFGWKG